MKIKCLMFEGLLQSHVSNNKTAKCNDWSSKYIILLPRMGERKGRKTEPSAEEVTFGRWGEDMG
jgi:hypothetical protein